MHAKKENKTNNPTLNEQKMLCNLQETEILTWFSQSSLISAGPSLFSNNIYYYVL